MHLRMPFSLFLAIDVTGKTKISKTTLTKAIKDLKDLWGSASFLADEAALAKVARYRKDLEALFRAFDKPILQDTAEGK
jgi:hypothetical protein